MSTATEAPPLTAKQRGRADVDFLGAMSAFANGALLEKARERFESESAGREIPRDFEGRLAAIQGVVDKFKEWRFDRLYARVVAEELAPTMVRAAIEVNGATEAIVGSPQLVPVDPNLEIPDYFNVNYHVSPWYSESPKYTYDPLPSVVPRIFNRAGVAAVPKGSNIFEQRQMAVAQARIEEPEKILDVGSGGGGAFLNTIQARYPNAQIHGVDLAARGLNVAAAMGKAAGNEFILSHQNGEDLNYDDATFDLVMSYALLHEVPVDATKNIINEAFRVLKPGGEMVMVDVPPYRVIEDFQFLVYDWETEGRVEPYWREAGLLDRGQLSREAGFADVEEYGLGDTHYPWVLRARKPRQES